MERGMPSIHGILLFSQQSFLHSHPPPPPHTHTHTLLQLLFSYLEEMQAEGLKHFGNGAGKLLIFHFLQLLTRHHVKKLNKTVLLHSSLHKLAWCYLHHEALSAVLYTCAIELQRISDNESNDNSMNHEEFKAFYRDTRHDGKFYRLMVSSN